VNNPHHQESGPHGIGNANKVGERRVSHNAHVCTEHAEEYQVNNAVKKQRTRYQYNISKQYRSMEEQRKHHQSRDEAYQQIGNDYRPKRQSIASEIPFKQFTI
jgi:hypothetical protein